jgi:hypothetical protein
MAGACVLMQRADVVDGMVAVAGQEKVWPVDPVVGPGQFVFMAVAQPPGTQIEALLG